MPASAYTLLALAGRIAGPLGKDLSIHRSTLMVEMGIHNRIKVVLTQLGLAHQREVVLGKGERLDFLLEGGVAIEVKKGNATLATYRQVCRYLAHDRVSGCVIICNRVTEMPTSGRSKPIAVIELWRYLL
jgi:hypothetical protein